MAGHRLLNPSHTKHMIYAQKGIFLPKKFQGTINYAQQTSLANFMCPNNHHWHYDNLLLALFHSSHHSIRETHGTLILFYSLLTDSRLATHTHTQQISIFPHRNRCRVKEFISNCFIEFQAWFVE